MPIDLYDRFHRYAVVTLAIGESAMMGAAWLWDALRLLFFPVYVKKKGYLQ